MKQKSPGTSPLSHPGSGVGSPVLLEVPSSLLEVPSSLLELLVVVPPPLVLPSPELVSVADPSASGGGMELPPLHAATTSTPTKPLTSARLTSARS
jgi:hypothetical protein